MIQNQIITFLKDFGRILKNLTALNAEHFLRSNPQNDFSRSGVRRNQSSEISLIILR